eukprot:5292309-Pleurochrysis_carterae.AAC.4
MHWAYRQARGESLWLCVEGRMHLSTSPFKRGCELSSRRDPMEFALLFSGRRAACILQIEVQ